ncbi:hypothetical protein BT96DRAFT_994239 [Gymnopus androsaceus JB14]|uniref:Uncharacterized protein n=1 Tax=Gymnopus androsaceus JB14 TaxID=1447944 RepID=A0A6A4HKX3_9AGAR|nr:hypothetical protein BT96DRAFT_994239 [Gymnopus androsaceus JB14]
MVSKEFRNCFIDSEVPSGAGLDRLFLRTAVPIHFQPRASEVEKAQIPTLPCTSSSSLCSSTQVEPLSVKEQQLFLSVSAHAVSDPSPRRRPELVWAHWKAHTLINESNLFNSAAASDSEALVQDQRRVLELLQWMEEQRRVFRSLSLTLGMWKDNQCPWSAVDEFMSVHGIEHDLLYARFRDERLTGRVKRL